MDHRLIRTGFVMLATLALSSAGARAQVLPPILVEPPTLILLPSYPPTTAPFAAGPYFATPAWDQTLTASVRFMVLTNFNSDAVLDRETGLVWARRALHPTSHIVNAELGCFNLTVDRRGGWRLPTVAELKSLLDFSIPAPPSGPRLAAGHPFALPDSGEFWTGQLVSAFQPNGTLFAYLVILQTGGVTLRQAEEINDHPTLCVRGPQ